MVILNGVTNECGMEESKKIKKFLGQIDVLAKKFEIRISSELRIRLYTKNLIPTPDQKNVAGLLLRSGSDSVPMSGRLFELMHKHEKKEQNSCAKRKIVQ